MSAVLPRYLWAAYVNRTAHHIGAVELAVALYRADHGKYPVSLEELVPTYLPSLPVDPMSNAGRSFGYIVAASGTRPVLICAGDDGIIQTTGESYLPSGVCYGWSISKTNKCDDQYGDLSAWKDPTSPAPTTLPALPESPAEPE